MEDSSLLPFLKPKVTIGLDIQPDEIRLLQLNRTKTECSIEKFEIKELPSGAIVDGQIKEPTQVVSAISQLVMETKTRGYPTAIALPSQHIITKHVSFPANFTESECENEISHNLNHYFPGIDVGLCFDFAIVKKDEEVQDLFLIAARLQQLNDYVNAVNTAGLVVNIVDSSFLALLRIIKLIDFENDIIGMLDINGHFAQLILVKQNTILFNQQINTKSTSDLIQQVQYFLNLWKASHELDCIVIYLSGRGPLLSEFLLKTTLNVKIPDPFSLIRQAPALSINEVTSMLLSCGLALRSVAKW